MKLSQSLFTASLFLALTAGLGCGGTTTTGGTGGTSTGGAPAGEKVIASIEITPNKDTLSKGSTQQFHATAHYADGTTEDITNSKDVRWNTSEPTVATVTKNGLVVANKEGLVDITVEYKGEKGEEHFVIMP
jgi:trimeric autotransporter adhesin